MSGSAKPFLKWAGGKRRLLDQFEDHYPRELKLGKITKYVEPFLGGGAVFFRLNGEYAFKEVVLNDINYELIMAYRVIQNCLDDLADILKPLDESFNKMKREAQKNEYYRIRNEYNREKLLLENHHDGEVIENVAKFIFLNKTCFNGLYRLNKRGKFNVPFGRYLHPRIYDENNLIAVNKALKGVKLISGDYKSVENHVEIDRKTFVYLDPPYRALPESPSFTSYSKGDFSEKNQVELSEWYKTLDKRGAYLMLSNSDPKNKDIEDNFFETHYSGFIIDRVYAGRIINAKVSGRSKITEILVKNYSI